MMYKYKANINKLESLDSKCGLYERNEQPTILLCQRVCVCWCFLSMQGTSEKKLQFHRITIERIKKRKNLKSNAVCGSYRL